MANTTNKFRNPRPFFKHLMGAEHFHKNRRSAIDYYWEYYTDKLPKVTGGRVLHDYDKPRFTLPKKYRR